MSGSGSESGSESEGDMNLAQLSADAMLEANVEAFNNFMGNYGVKGDELLAQLSSELD